MQTTPQIESILEELATLVISPTDSSDLSNRIDKLTESLSVNGWRRHSSDEKSLRGVIDEKVHSRQSGSVTQHHGEVDALLDQIKKSYDGLASSTEAPASVTGNSE